MDLKQFLVKKCVECLMSDKTHYNVIHVTAWVSMTKITISHGLVFTFLVYLQ